MVPSSGPTRAFVIELELGTALVQVGAEEFSVPKGWIRGIDETLPVSKIQGSFTLLISL